MTKVTTQRVCVLALAATFLACSSTKADDDPDPETGGSGGSTATGGTAGTSGGSGEGGTEVTGGTGAVGGAGAAGGAGATGGGGAGGAAGASGTAGTAGVIIVGGAGGAGSGGGGAGGAGGSAGAGDMRRFVPDIPNTYESTTPNPGLEVIAHTLRIGLLGAEWLVAIENTGTSHICVLDIESIFFNASNTEIAAGTAIVEVPLERGSSGTGGLVECLGPGQIGMAVDQLTLSDVTDPTVIASVKHNFSGLILEDAAPTNDIVVTGVRVVTDTLGRNQFTGQIRNDSDVTVRNPAISIFGVNAVGRPLVEGSDIELTTIAAGASWTFTTNSFEESVEGYVAFPRVSE